MDRPRSGRGTAVEEGPARYGGGDEVSFHACMLPATRRMCHGLQPCHNQLGKKEDTLSSFYERLIKKGKKPKVALVALMRKIVVIANARLKEYYVAKK